MEYFHKSPYYRCFVYVLILFRSIYECKSDRSADW